MKRGANRTKKGEMCMWRKSTGKRLKDMVKDNEGETVPGLMIQDHNLGKQAQVCFQDMHARILAFTIYSINSTDCVIRTMSLW